MDSCRHTPWAELKLSIRCGMFLHRDQGLTRINDACVRVCLCVMFITNLSQNIANIYPLKKLFSNMFVHLLSICVTSAKPRA